MTAAWRTVAHVRIEPPEADWRERLATRLGHRPRRLGAWTELALHGALRCLDAAGEPGLPAGAMLRVASLVGPLEAIRAIVAQGATGLPMPFSFMQSQPSQMLAALSQHLRWQGDGRMVVGRDPDALLSLAQLECESERAAPEGLLFGWVEEGRRSEWWRLRPQ